MTNEWRLRQVLYWHSLLCSSCDPPSNSNFISNRKFLFARWSPTIEKWRPEGVVIGCKKIQSTRSSPRRCCMLTERLLHLDPWQTHWGSVWSLVHKWLYKINHQLHMYPSIILQRKELLFLCTQAKQRNEIIKHIFLLKQYFLS